MGTFAQLFESGEQKSQKGHFRNLIFIARFDGKVVDAESGLLKKIARSLSLTEEQLNEIINKPEDYPVIPPHSREERYERYIQLLEMAFVDGVFSHEELTFVKKLGIAMGFSEETIDTKTSVIVDKLKSGNTKDQILSTILQ